MCVSQPDSYAPQHAKLIKKADGIVDRILVYIPRASSLEYESVKGFNERLSEYSLRNLSVLMSVIYHNHNASENTEAQADVLYTLSPEAETAFNNYTRLCVAEANDVFQGRSQHIGDSKNEKHALRLAVVVHVVTDTLEKLLRRIDPSDPITPPANEISEKAMKGGIALAEYFSEQRNCLSKVSMNLSNWRVQMYIV